MFSANRPFLYACRQFRAGVSVSLAECALKITIENRESFVADEHLAEVRWRGDVGQYFGENIGCTSSCVIFVEINNIAE